LRSQALTAVLAAVLTMTGVAVAAPAQAAPACTITNFSPRTVVVGASPVTKTFGVSTTGCTRTSWSVMESEFDFYVSKSSPQHTFNPWNNAEAGTKDVIVSATNADYSSRERVFANGLKLLRATQWQSGSFNAGPEPVQRGGKVTLRGRLIVADWSTDRYVPHAGIRVDVQFRTPTGTYRTVASTTTASDGWARVSVATPGTGIWRLSYAGSSVAAPSAAVGDTVQMVG
jgi:hypothetical protein